MYCTNCGNKLSKTIKICPKCGHEQKNNENIILELAKNYKERKISKRVEKTLITSFVLLGILILIFLIAIETFGGWALLLLCSPLIPCFFASLLVLISFLISDYIECNKDFKYMSKLKNTENSNEIKDLMNIINKRKSIIIILLILGMIIFLVVLLAFLYIFGFFQ